MDWKTLLTPEEIKVVEEGITCLEARGPIIKKFRDAKLKWKEIGEILKTPCTSICSRYLEYARSDPTIAPTLVPKAKKHPKLAAPPTPMLPPPQTIGQPFKEEAMLVANQVDIMSDCLKRLEYCAMQYRISKKSATQLWEVYDRLGRLFKDNYM